MSIGRVFHIAHVVEELAPLDRWYDEVFAPVRGVMDNNYAPRLERMASLLVIGDTVIEAMSPSDKPEAASLPIGRFQSKFGRHWHSVAWYCTDIVGMWERMQEHGLRVLSGSWSDGPPTEGAMFSHPKDTASQLEFFQPPATHGGPEGPGPFADPRFEPEWPARWADSPNPLGITRQAYVTIVVADLPRAREVYCAGLGGQLLAEETNALSATASAYVARGPETVIELAHPTDPASLAGQELAANGGMCHAVAFQVDDLDRTAAHLARVGVGLAGRDQHTLLADPADTFGAPYRFTTRILPGDPRD